MMVLARREKGTREKNIVLVVDGGGGSGSDDLVVLRVCGCVGVCVF